MHSNSQTTKRTKKKSKKNRGSTKKERKQSIQGFVDFFTRLREACWERGPWWLTISSAEGGRSLLASYWMILWLTQKKTLNKTKLVEHFENKQQNNKKETFFFISAFFFAEDQQEFGCQAFLFCSSRYHLNDLEETRGWQQTLQQIWSCSWESQHFQIRRRGKLKARLFLECWCAVHN